MNAKQRRVLITFADKRQHVVIDGCSDPDCKKEFHAALTDLAKLCEQARREQKRLENKRRANEVKQ